MTPLSFPGARDIFTIKPDGTGLRRLTANQLGGARSGQPRWTPDGSGITYTEWTGDISPARVHRGGRVRPASSDFDRT